MRILVIEDDAAINKALKLTLEKEGYAVDSFTDPVQGKRHVLLNAADYDLAVFDVLMPGASGIEICTALRENGISLPIIMLTALSSPKDKVRALDAGADDYVTKPFSSEELAARVRAVLRRPKATLRDNVTLGELNLSVSDKKVSYKNKGITLTLKEFRILEYLMRNPRRIVTQDELLDHVWDLGFSSFSNVVEVHINKLRKKLRNKGLTGAIKTVRGMGYAIDVDHR